MTKVFGHGGLRLFLLMLLDEQPQHGYDLIKMVEDRFLGMYTPSAGTVYPRLQSLEDEGLIEHEEIDGRKVYRLTEAGRRELDERRSELDELQRRAVESARHLAGTIREEVRGSVREMRDDLRHAMKDVKRQERWAARQARGGGWDPFGAGGLGDLFGGGARPSGGGPRRREERGRADADPGGSRLELRSLHADLDAFVDDVMARARGMVVDRAGVDRARSALLDARDAVLTALGGSTPEADRPGPDGGPGAAGPGHDPAEEDGPDHWA
ncbi:MAG TPA: helix-turn-helix transcriptional regulator [Acidimicrobiales bacterium]|nr:helix-turn-helix transcriptional regulator [Acidimicrobiales bacterium]